MIDPPYMMAVASKWSPLPFGPVGILLAEWHQFENRIGGPYNVVTKFVLEPKHDTELSQPSFQLTADQAQRLMDSLWDCGLRPTGAAGSAGAMEAVQRHLNDMREIAFSRLELKQP